MIKDNEVRKEIKELVEEFRANYQRYKGLTEANIETKLVEELFINVLGWTKNDFVKQERTQRRGKKGRADYAFYIGDKIVFFLEVKRVGIPLDKEADKQVISYALSKRVPFAISTNFEELKIFCVEQENAIERVFRIFKQPEDYINNLQDLLFLSKDSFERNLILKKAESEDRLKKRISIDKTLLNDLIHIRKLIADDIEKTYPKKYESNEKDDIVQRIIDRLIFIRRCEDVGINPDNLYLEEIKNLPDNKAYLKLKNFFERYNEVYNSGLFAIGVDNDCDTIRINGNIIKKLIGYLYESKDKQYIYNFDWIDADVLGQIYEQYLGKILQQTKSGRAKLKEGQVHRKEQGIYYTPTNIVDFIVKNTVGEILKKKGIKSRKLKILDPACGSGSFLIKAFDYLYKDMSGKGEAIQHKLDSQGNYSIKTEIIKNNLYGVDLDNKAVEITKLNLLLKASEKNRKLPEEIDMHIRHGNSLIDDENIAKLDAFKWEKNFQEGDFDIVIGNPPWVSVKGKHKSIDLSDKELDYLINKYNSNTYMPNLYEMFIWKGLSLIKERGLFSFIVPDRFCYNKQFINLRKDILNNFSIKKLYFKVPFERVIADTVIFVIEKSKKKNNNVEVAEFPDKQFTKIPQKIFSETTDCSFFFVKKEIYDIFQRIKLDKNCIPLSKLVQITSGCGAKSSEITKDKKNNSQIPILKGESIQRYLIRNKYWFEFCDENLTGRTRDKSKLGKKLKVLLRKTGSDLIATFDDSGVYPEQSLYFLYTENDNNKEILINILAILNSKLINCYYRNFAITNRDSTPQLKNMDLDKFPIILPKDRKILIGYVNNIILLNQQLKDSGDKTTRETKDIKEKIENVNEKIEKVVYNLYGISPKEKEIIKKS